MFWSVSLSPAFRVRTERAHPDTSPSCQGRWRDGSEEPPLFGRGGTIMRQYNEADSSAVNQHL